jgi:hypothetical protein
LAVEAGVEAELRVEVVVAVLVVYLLRQVPVQRFSFRRALSPLLLQCLLYLVELAVPAPVSVQSDQVDSGEGQCSSEVDLKADKDPI